MVLEGLIRPFSLAFGRLLPLVAFERMAIERLTLALVVAGRSSAISRKISRNICRRMATSAI
jgi:hypothetical protein